MKTKVITLAAIVLVGLLAYFLFMDLKDMSDELEQKESASKPVVVPGKPKISQPAKQPEKKVVRKPKKKPQKVAKKPCCKKHYKVTYGRKPDVVSQPLWVPKDKTGYYQDAETGRWYWKGD